MQSREPPLLLVKLGNPIVKRLVASGRAPEGLLLLHFTGRRTGRAYDLPVGYQVIDGVHTVTTNRPWRLNVADAREVEVTLRGERRPATARLDDDPDVVARTYLRLIGDLGPRRAQQRLGLRIDVPRLPTLDEVREAVERSGLALVRLDLR